MNHGTRHGVLAVLATLLTFSLAAARDEEGVCGVLDGISSMYEESHRTTWYWPRFPGPMTYDLRAFPELGLTEDGERMVFLRVLLKDPPRKAATWMEVRIDGQAVPLPESGLDVVVTSIKACRPVLWISFTNIEELVRRIGAATEVQFGFGKPKDAGLYRLNQDDLDRFRRMVALLDTHSLPSGEAIQERSKLSWNASGGGRGGTLPSILQASKAMPKYPQRARRKGVMGRVVLEAIIYREGTVGDLRVLYVDGIDCGFEESAMEAVRQWRYEPATDRGGEPIDVPFTITVDYELH